MEKERRWEEKDRKRGDYNYTRRCLCIHGVWSEIKESFWNLSGILRRGKDGAEDKGKSTTVNTPWRFGAHSKRRAFETCQEPRNCSRLKASNSFSLLHLVAGGTLCVAGGISVEMCFCIFLFVVNAGTVRDRGGSFWAAGLSRSLHTS